MKNIQLSNYCRWDNYESVASLLNKHSDIDIMYEEGKYFRFAIQNNNPKILGALLEYFEETHKHLDHESFEYKEQRQKLLEFLEDAADTFSISSAIQEVLDHHSIYLQEESDIDEQELIDAAADGNVYQIQQILDKGKVDINFQEARYGHTALHLASQNGHDEAMKVLIQRGADQDITNNKGLKPNEVYKMQHVTEEQCQLTSYLNQLAKDTHTEPQQNVAEWLKNYNSVETNDQPTHYENNDHNQDLLGKDSSLIDTH